LAGRGHEGGVLNVAWATAAANPRTLRTTGRARLCFPCEGHDLDCECWSSRFSQAARKRR